jgi:hypothetical protein
LLQLLELLGRQDLRHFRLHVSFKRVHLFLLVGGQIEPLGRPGRQDANGAAVATALGLRPGRRLRCGRWLRRGGLRPNLLGVEKACGGSKCQE